MAESVARTLVNRARAAQERGQTALALCLYDDALALLDDSADPLFADALRWKGTLLRERGETDRAHRCYTTSLALAERAESIGAQAHALNCLAIISQRRGETRETEKLYGRAADLAQKAGESRLLGMIEQNRGVLANMRGDLADAEQRYSSSLAAFQNAQDTEAVSWVLNNLGMLYNQRGEHAKAREVLEQGLSLARKDPAVASILTLNLAEAWLIAGNLDSADEACRVALDSAQRRGDHLTAAGALKCRARIERERGSFDKGMATLRIAIYEAQGTEDRLLHAELLRELGELSRTVGNAAGAKSAWREAEQAFKLAGARADAAAMQTRVAEIAD